RKLQPAIRGAVEEPRTQRFDLGALAAIGVENLTDAPAQRDARLAAEREQRVERPAGSGLGGARRQAFEQAEFECRGEIEDLIADGEAAAGGATRHAEYAERQVLDRKVGVPIGRGDPTAPRG